LGFTITMVKTFVFVSIIGLHHHYGEDLCFCQYYYYYFSVTPLFSELEVDFLICCSLGTDKTFDPVLVTLTYFSRSQRPAKSNFLKFQM